MNSILNSLPNVLPIVCDWAEKQEMIALEEGMPLTESQLADARMAKVAHPEKIRVNLVDKLPQPDHEELMFMAHQVGLFSERTTSLSLGYGIWLLPEAWTDRQALVHECVHVGQHEQLKGLRPFLGEYLRECIDPGYPFGRMEQESILVAKDICKAITAKLPV
jgi:hypothetical protein